MQCFWSPSLCFSNYTCSVCSAVSSCFALRLEAKKEQGGIKTLLYPFILHAWMHRNTLIPSYEQTKHHIRTEAKMLTFCIGRNNILLIKYTQSHNNSHTHTHTLKPIFVFTQRQTRGEQPSVFEHEWADVVVALHAWVRLYSTWLQYPTGLQMGSNTLTQLSDQTNWVWDCVYARVWRRTLVCGCLGAYMKYCPLLPFYPKVHVWLRSSPCLCRAASCTCNDCIRQPPSHRTRLTFAPTCLPKFIHFSPTRK